MKLNRFAKYAWVVLAYSIGVVLWGAYVRATGSGAGCGNHWPLCGDVVIPQSPAVATMIEFSHRVTSGLTVVFVAGLLLWALRSYPKGHAVRLGARLAFVFTITEALVGAGLVLFQLVAHNDSIARAASVAVHLANTFLLLASLTLTAAWASGAHRLRLAGRARLSWPLGIGLLGVLILGVTGAITALGDTLFPSGSLVEGMAQDFSPTAHFLIRLRVIHPVIATLIGVYVVILARLLASSGDERPAKRLATLLTGLVGLQLLAGLVNVVLMAPIWLQMVHLLLADLLWITFVLFSAGQLAVPLPQAGKADLFSAGSGAAAANDALTVGGVLKAK
jgi:heme A synthase